MIWAYYIQLSTHMWDDESAKPRGLYLPAGSTGDMYGYGENGNNCVDISTWDTVVAYVAEKKFNTLVIDLGDGVMWESHPEIAAPNAWSKELLKKKLDEIRKLGLTPIPKMNFSSCHDTWLKEYRRLIGTSIYRKVCEDLITEACELFDKPTLFHLGLDEECSVGCSAHSELIFIRGERLLWEDYHFLMEAARKNGARPWMWADYFWDRSELFVKNVSTDVLVSNWYYSMFRDYTVENWLTRSQAAYQSLNKYGYDQVPTCSTCAGSQTSAYETMVHCKRYVDEKHLLGFMTASWFPTMPDETLALENDAFRFYRGRTLVYPESIK